MLVIFDCDGVLVDSEGLVAEVFSQGLRDLGVDISDQQCLERFMGRSMQSCRAEILDLVGGPIPPAMSQRMQAETKAKFENELQTVNGIEQVIAGLKALGIQDCVASSGQHKKMRLSLGKTGLWSHFEGRIYSADDVVAAKPAPDVFLYAAAQQGFEPHRCIVIEDSATGVEAALAANMPVLFFNKAAKLQPHWSDLAVQQFDHMRHLLPLLQQHQLNRNLR